MSYRLYKNILNSFKGVKLGGSYSIRTGVSKGGTRSLDKSLNDGPRFFVEQSYRVP